LLPDKTTVGLSVSISFARIGGRVSDKKLIEACEEALDKLGAQVANALVEVDEAEKRK
jgi:hypothetical protein